MNELQQVLIIFAVIVIIGLYFFSRKKPADVEVMKKIKPDDGNINNPKSAKPQPDLVLEESKVPENQGVLPFAEFQTPVAETENKMRADKVLIIDDLMHESDFDDLPPLAAEALQSQEEQKAKEIEPETFAILVQTTNTKKIKMADLDALFTSLDLVYNQEQRIYVKKYLGKTGIYVANILNPGTFPTELDAEIASPGVALVTQLPSKIISSTKAMEDLLWTARRISQQMQGRLYDQNRKILSESDLQAMQEKAKQFENSNLEKILR